MFQYAFMQNALIVSLIIAVLAPCIGIFLVLRRMAMIGDALAHASLAGVTVGLLTGSNPILGAFLFTSISGLLIEFLRHTFRKYTELILSIVLAIGVGTAVTLISSGKLSANADNFLYGSVLTVTAVDLYAVLGLTVLAVGILVFLYNQLLYIAFDEEAAQVAGVRVRLINYMFAVLAASVIAMTIRIVGVLVISSMLTLPVATAMQFGQGFRRTLLISICVSIFDLMAGLILSFYLNVAPGGLTALISVGALLFVLLMKQLRQKRRRRLASGPESL
jgi:zinc transport system permease protein